MTYNHTQHAPLWFVLLVPAVICLGTIRLLHLPAALGVLFCGLAVGLVLLALCLQTLTVRDEGSHLAIRYGPLPLFQTRIAYAEMHTVNPARSKWIDGWGIHYGLGRGWTYKLWGFDCVEISTNRGLIRVGSDDADGLAEFLWQTRARRSS